MHRHPGKPNILRKVAPPWIDLLDQPQLPRAVPLLDPLLALDCEFHCPMLLEPDEQLDRVIAGKAGDQALAVLMDSLEEVGSYADVERAVSA